MTTPHVPPTPRSPAAAPSGQPSRTVGDESIGSRLSQAAMAVVLAVISVMLLLTTHRLEAGLLGVDLPVGLLFGAALQVVICLFLWAATGSRFPLLVLGCLWGVLAVPFLGEGVGGGVLLPAALGDQVQYSGWIVQGIGLVVPFAAAAAITLARRRRTRTR
ncbi:hypothetical protein ACT3SP_06485 [Brachybacterium sp. AOP43-C2-M15]|uniref:hypothetical protein n=1 Tax=Brachybacterium sp. AOP43-C2-M15 TaxID=3457661 RepID=UPI004034A893